MKRQSEMKIDSKAPVSRKKANKKSSPRSVVNGQPALSILTRNKASICTEDGKKVFTNQSSVDELVRVLYNNEWTLAKIVNMRPANDGSLLNNYYIEIQEGPGKGSGIDINATEKHDKMRSVDIIEETLHEQGNLIDSNIYKLLKQFQSKKNQQNYKINSRIVENPLTSMRC